MLHPLNPEYWIHFATLYEQALGSTSGLSPDNKSSEKLLLSARTATHEKLSYAPISRLPLYNPNYRCRMCMLENCNLCCIYSHQVTETGTQTECCNECPKQDLAPEVHFQTMGCTCLEQPEAESMASLDVVKKTKIRHGCTSLLQTPYQTLSNKNCGQSSKTVEGCEPHKHLNSGINELCDKLNDEILEDRGTVKTGKGHMDVKTRKAVCIALVRAR